MEVVFIHWGDNDYLNLAVGQAIKYGNKSVVIIKNPLTKYGSMEIDRWFVLRDYMLASDLKRCLYIDSDVLLFQDVQDDFLDCDLAFSKSHCGHTMFVNSIHALSGLCSYIDHQINNLSLIEATRKRLVGHVFPDTMGDMVLLNNFMFNSNWVFRDTSKPHDDAVYSHNINTEGLPVMINGLPYMPYLGKFVRLKSIHFQGAAKERMRNYV